MKRFIRLVAFLLSVSFSFSSGCKNKSNGSIIDVIDLYKGDIFNRYIDDLDDHIISYDIEDPLFTSEEVNRSIRNIQKLNKVNCDNESNFDYDRICEIIKFNSMIYLENNKGYYSAFSSEDSECSLYQEIFEKVLRDSFEVMEKSATNDYKEDLCKISDLKIVFSENIDDITIADYNPPNNVIRIFINRVKKNTVYFNKDEIYDYMMDLILHELNHARHVPCDCRSRKVPFVYNVFYNVNCFLKESAAESELYNLKKSHISKDDISHSYASERNSEAIILLLGLCNGKNIDEYYNAILDTDIYAFHDFLGLSSEDIFEFYKVLHIIDGVYGRSNIIDREDLDETEINKLVGYDYVNSIYKMCLKNMIKYTMNNNDFSLKENLGLFQLMRTKILEKSYLRGAIAHRKINEDGSETVTVENFKTFDDSFTDNFIDLSDIYISFICEYYEIDRESVNAILNSEEFYKLPIYMDLLSISGTTMQYDDSMNFLLSLVDRFPILNAIYFCGYPNPDTYYEMIESNSVSYSK